MIPLLLIFAESLRRSTPPPYSGWARAAKIAVLESPGPDELDECRRRPRTSATSPSSPTSTTARAPSPTSSCSRPAPSPSATSRPRRSTAWTSNASAASPSACTRSRSTTSTTAQKYELNLIDTPGHVDFNYEVSRSLAACEGAILLVDAFQGVQAQTVANAFLAMERDLDDRPGAQQDRPAASPGPTTSSARWSTALGDRPGRGAARQRQDRHRRRGGARGRSSSASRRRRATRTRRSRRSIYNSHFDTYKGVVVYVRVMDGAHQAGQQDQADARPAASTTSPRSASSAPAWTTCDELAAGQVGYFTAKIKNIDDVHIGDTVTDAAQPDRRSRWPGYKEPKPMVYSGLYPVNNNEFEDLREALGKLQAQRLQLHLSARKSREGLGFGFRCGFLGMLHREIIQQRLERDSDLEPRADRAERHLRDPEARRRGRSSSTARRTCPTPGRSRSSASRSCKISFLVPAENIGDLMQMCADRRGTFVRTEYLSPQRVILVYEMPLAEVIYDLYDKLKSRHARLRHDGLRGARLPRRRPGAAGHPRARQAGRCAVGRSSTAATPSGAAGSCVKKLREEIDRHLFEVALQAAIGSRVIARETIAAMRKNVTAKCYGGDITRKRKLLGEAGRGQEADEAGRPGRDPAGGVPGGAGAGRVDAPDPRAADHRRGRHRIDRTRPPDRAGPTADSARGSRSPHTARRYPPRLLLVLVGRVRLPASCSSARSRSSRSACRPAAWPPRSSATTARAPARAAAIPVRVGCPAAGGSPAEHFDARRLPELRLGKRDQLLARRRPRPHRRPRCSWTRTSSTSAARGAGRWPSSAAPTPTRRSSASRTSSASSGCRARPSPSIDGDVYANGELLRKGLAELRETRVIGLRHGLRAARRVGRGGWSSRRRLPPAVGPDAGVLKGRRA